MSAQSRRASLLEALAKTAIGFFISLLATLIILPAVGVAATINQSVAMTLGFTVISIARSYILRRLFNRPGRTIETDMVPTHYHVDCGGVSIYKGGVPVARIDLDKSQMVGLSIAILKSSRETNPISISNFLRRP